MEDEHPLVQGWADWSRRLIEQWVREHGIAILHEHDQSIEDLKSSLRAQRIDLNPALVAGLGWAAHLVAIDEQLDPEAKKRLFLTIGAKAGLAAEATQNAWDNFKFFAITSRFAAATTERKGGHMMRRIPLKGTFSCNKNGDVWRPTGYGFTPLEERVNLKGIDPRLDEIVCRVLTARSAGGRFVIDDGEVFLAEGQAQVA